MKTNSLQKDTEGIVLQLCADFYKNCAIDDTNLKFCEVLENIISQIFGYRDIPYSVLNTYLT